MFALPASPFIGIPQYSTTDAAVDFFVKDRGSWMFITKRNVFPSA